MAVQRRVNYISQQRVDVPDMRAVESAASNDWDQAIQAFVTNTTQGYILRGFEISMTGAIGGASSNLQMEVDPGAVMHIAASQSGTILMVPPGTSAQQLNSATNTNVVGAFAPNALNYVGIDYIRYIDPTTDAQVYIWDPTTMSETTKTAPRAQILQYQLNISTASWPSNLLPIAIVQTDASNNVVAITDCRWLLFRLGTGGASPNPFYTYPWTAQPEGRTENPSTSSSNSINPFEGGDKMLFSLKDWMNAVMSSLLEVKGTTFWYSGGSGSAGPIPGSIAKLREDAINTITVGDGTITHGVLPNNDPVLVTTGALIVNTNTITGLASTTGLVNGLFIFGTGIPAGTTITNVVGSTVTMSKNSTVTNPTEALQFFSPTVVTSPGQINWSDPFYLKVIGTSLSYQITANPSSADILLADDEVAYIILNRDAVIAPNLFYTYNSGPNTTTVVSIGAISWTAPLLANDFIKASTDPDSAYTQIKTVDSSTQVTLYGNYVPASQTAAGVPSLYTLGTYNAVASPSGPRDIFLAQRAAVPTGQNVFWLFAREDVGGPVPTVYVHFLGQELSYGDSNQIDDGIPKQLLQYIGSPAESASKPSYTSALIPGSLPQIVHITTGSAATVAANQYFAIYSSTAQRLYYVWIKKDGTGADPAPYAYATGLEWDVTTGQTNVQLASSLATLLNSTFFNDFTAVASSNTIVVTNNSAGSSGTPVNINVGAPFAITVSQTGTGIGNSVVQDGDNLTLAIKKLDDAIGTIISHQPGYDETVAIVASGATPPQSLNGPIAPSTNIQLPPNSRNSNLQLFYQVGDGKLEVFLNGQKLIVGIDYTEVGASGSASDMISNSFALVVGDELEFTFGGGGGGSGGGAEGPPGPQGPQGIPGANAVGGPVAISTKTSNYGVSLSDNVLLADCTTGAITFTLPNPTTVGATGRVYFFKKIDATANALSLIVSGGANIDFLASQSTTVQGYAWTVICDGTQYWLF